MYYYTEDAFLDKLNYHIKNNILFNNESYFWIFREMSIDYDDEKYLNLCNRKKNNDIEEFNYNAITFELSMFYYFYDEGLIDSNTVIIIG